MTPPRAAIRLSADDSKKQEEFFASPRVPRRLERLVEEYVAKKTGKAWNDPVVLDRIRSAVVAQKGGYWSRGRGRITYTKGYDVLAYLAYQFPVYLVQTEVILHRLAMDRLLPAQMRVLDAGCGPGVVSLAVIDYLARIEGVSASIEAIDLSEEHVEAYLSLVPAYAERKGQVSVARPVRGDLTDPPKGALQGPFDLILFSNVLNELPCTDPADRAAVVARFMDRLSPDGTMVLVEPAERESSTALREVQQHLVSRGYTVYAPCTPLWGEACRPERCWTFAGGPEIRPPRLMEALAAGEEGYRFRNTDIKYSYAIIRRDGRTRERYRIAPTMKVARLSSLADHVGRRINLCTALMSADIGDEKRHVVKICDGTTTKPVYAVMPVYTRNTGNDALLSGEYGGIVVIRNATVRYNAGADTFSVIIGRKTTIEPAGRGADR
ncbi:small ribosomal subunit Rsm22 family protein [Methanofollis fontis]|uniref:DUF8157 domain-containing protein n=1 Tax=Methanofollis fontis TaxID=2052832 RepID=A0A483CWC4_9EURY|nr:class I SAM-dependent methyltransferase [Methanofollis fontis]TAJ45480.1 hypothetical protein CUJ86_01765 [Methanofollis fontis]